ncbi:hypothetical protein [Yoonia sp. SS1-5]|uniref:Uncharacterized protein n=1 Tax=Yoonia rhodophyticola TaxID=3137370 RepID=A0AAN0M9P2_9RHOB
MKKISKAGLVLGLSTLAGMTGSAAAADDQTRYAGMMAGQPAITAADTAISSRTTPVSAANRPDQDAAMSQLLALISRAESPVHGYDSVHFGARIKPGKPPSQLTVAEIQAWVRATPGQPHAIGRNQIIPATFNRLVSALGLSGDTVYDRPTQDRMGRYLIEEAGYARFIAGRMSHDAFMDRLAKVWAGLPMADGRSAYHRYAGNRATITRAEYASAIMTIFPMR